jgi:hypothetical protein
MINPHLTQKILRNFLLYAMKIRKSKGFFVTALPLTAGVGGAPRSGDGDGGGGAAIDDCCCRGRSATFPRDAARPYPVVKLCGRTLD